MDKFFQSSTKSKSTLIGLPLIWFIAIGLLVVNFLFNGIGMDRWGNLGSLLTGIPLYLLLVKEFNPENAKTSKVVKTVALTALAGVPLVLIIVMYARELEDC